MNDFIHPMIYTGPKPQKDMSHIFPGRPLVFKPGPLSEQPGPLEGQKYADVTEKEGRHLVKRFPDLFKWPEGTQLGPQIVSREEFDDLKARFEALLSDLTSAAAVEAEEPKKRGKKAEPVTEGGA